MSKYYLVTFSTRPYLINIGNNIRTRILNILKSCINGYCEIAFDSFVIKSFQSIEYWEKLIISEINCETDLFYIIEIKMKSDSIKRWLLPDQSKWIDNEIFQINQTTCKDETNSNFANFTNLVSCE